MDLLIVEPLESEVLQWLDGRHELFYAPGMPQDRRVFLDVLADTRAALLPQQARIDADVVAASPRLRAIGRIAGGVDGLDMAACARSGIEVVRPTDAAAPAEAEFMLGALLALLRPSPEESKRVTGRELGACTVGLVGMTPAARTLARYVAPLGSRLIGYDPGVHATDPQWARWGVQASGLPELFAQADAVCVQLPYFSRYKGLLGDRVLERCRPGQVLVSISPLDLFDDTVLADALQKRRISAAWLDSLEPGALSPGRPLANVRGLISTPRLGAYTREARVRSAWSVARRLDEILRAQPRSGRKPGSTGRALAAKNSPPTVAAPPSRDQSLPEVAPGDEVLDIRNLLPKASELDLRGAVAAMGEVDQTAPSAAPVTVTATHAPATPPVEAPRRRYGEDEYTLSRSS